MFIALIITLSNLSNESDIRSDMSRFVKSERDLFARIVPSRKASEVKGLHFTRASAWFINYVMKTILFSDIKISRSSIRDYLENNNGRYNNPWIWDVKLNYRRGPSHIEKRAGMPKERWKWAFASIRASAEKYAKTSAVRAEYDVSVWFWSTGRIGALRKTGSTLADRKGPTGCAPHTDTDTPVGARLT